jgi:Leucine-rich repeat (LRR) protein
VVSRQEQEQSKNDIPLHWSVRLIPTWIDSLPSSLFLLTNLTVLSLREFAVRSRYRGDSKLIERPNLFLGANKLERLPAGVGQLKRLKELNVSNNSIVSPARLKPIIAVRSS